MAELILGLRPHTWALGAAFVAPFLWWGLWKWRGRRWFNKGWYKLMEGSEDHEEILELQAKHFGRLFNWVIWACIILLDMNMSGRFNVSSTTSRNIWITGGTITGILALGGGAYISFLLASVRLLLERGFGRGNYVTFYSEKYHKEVSGWVAELGLFKTTFRTNRFTVIHIRNSLLLNYITENYDSGPFYHEIFNIALTQENRDKIIGVPPSKTNTAGTESEIIQKLRVNLDALLLKPESKDREPFEEIFKNMDDSTWAWVSQPSILLEGEHAILRVPVRSYRHGLVLKHEISRLRILEV